MYLNAKSKMTVRRGDIYYVNSIYSEVGSEMKSGRPAVIVSSDFVNESDLGIVEICYLTLRDKKRLPTRIVLTQEPCKDSTVLCEQITTVSKDRLGDFITHLDEGVMSRIDGAIVSSLGLDLDRYDDSKEGTSSPSNYDEELNKYKAQAVMYKNLYESVKATVDSLIGEI